MNIDISNLIVALQAVVPAFVLIGIGGIIKWRQIMNSDDLKKLNHMTFEIFYFGMMFYNIYISEIATSFRPRLIIFSLVSLAIVYIAVFGLVCIFCKSNKRRGALIQGLYRSNFVFLGIPLMSNMFGTAELSVTNMMIAIVVPIYNVLGVFTLEFFRGGKLKFFPLFISILKNPMIRGALFGLVCKVVLPFTFPPFIMQPLAQVANTATILALMILGASFQMGSTKLHRLPLFLCVVGRLFIIPAIVLFFAIKMGFRGIELGTLMSIFATPCAIAGFIMAQEMNSDADLAGNSIVISTLLSAFTMFAWILFLKEMGLL